MFYMKLYYYSRLTSTSLHPYLQGLEDTIKKSEEKHRLSVEHQTDLVSRFVCNTP